MSAWKHAAIVAISISLLAGWSARADTFGLETLELQHVQQSWGEPHANQSVEGHPIFLDGQRYDHGLGTHAESLLRVVVDGQAESFTATVGVDDEVGEQGAVVF